MEEFRMDAPQLQFDRAEFTDTQLKCAQCSSPIASVYFLLSNQKICSSCSETAKSTQSRGNASHIMSGIVYGAGAAFACCVVYAIITMTTGMQLALISIAVGYLIGKAMRKGSEGFGGRRLQVAAVVLTYLSITGSYIPLMYGEMAKVEAKRLTAANNGETSQAATALKTITPQGRAIVTLILATGTSFLFPIFELAHPASGVIGLLILYFGLSRAWKETARDSRLLMGPYALGAQNAGA
jgi:hypothetical protein